MNSVRWTKILRDVRLSRARTLLVVAAIGVGVGAFSMMSAGRTILERDMRNGFTDSQPAHAILSLGPFDDGLTREVAGMSGVAAAEGRRVLTTRVAVESDTFVTLQLQAVRDWNALTISRLMPEAGTSIDVPPEGILLERSTARHFGLVVGQPLRLRTSRGAEHELTIVGLVSDQGITPSNVNTTTAYGYIGLQTLPALDEPLDFNQLYVRLAGDRAAWPDVEPDATRITRAIEQGGVPVYRANIPRPDKPPLWDTMSGVLFILGTMGLLTLALSGFLIVNVMWAIVTRQIPQIGVIKSVGGRWGQIMRLYLEMVFIFGLLALVVAVPVALGGAFGLTTGMGKPLNVTITSFGLPPATLFTLVIAALVVPALAALVPITTGARITIREAIGGQAGAPRKARRWVGARDGTPRAFLSSIPTLLLLSVRNTFRRSGRTALTLVALSLAGAMFVAVLGVRQSLHRAALEIQAETNYDVELSFVQPYPIADILRTAGRVPEIEDTEAWGIGDVRRVFDADRVGGSMLLIGLPPDTSMALPGVIAGRRLEAGDSDAVFLNADALALLQDAAVGQPVTLRVGSEERSWKIVGASGIGFFPTAYIPYADFERATGVAARAGRLVARIRDHSPEAQRAAEAALLAAFQEDGMQVSRSSTTAENRRAIAGNLDIIAIMLLSMVALVAVVGGLGLASTMGINVMERTREIGVLRSLGARAPVVRRVVLVEGLVIALLSVVFGLVASVPLGMWLGGQLGPRVLYFPLPFVFSWPATALWLVIVCVIAVLASLAPAQSAARMTIRETLAYEG